MSNTDPQTNTRSQNHLKAVPAGPAFAKEYDDKQAAAQKRESRKFWASVGAATLATGALLGVGSNALSDRQAPPPTPAVAPPATGDVTPNPANVVSVPVQPGDTVWAYAANRTPLGGDTAPMEAAIEEQLDDDGTPGLQAFNPQNGTGDVLELSQPLPPLQDANPNNDQPTQG